MKFILISLLIFPLSGFARTIFEPTFSYTYGTISEEVTGVTNITNGQSVESTSMSTNLGFRYGITRQYVHVTAIGEGMYLNEEVDNDAFDTTSEFVFNYGIGLGWEWNVPVRTYILLTKEYVGAELGYYFNEGFLLALRYSFVSDFAVGGSTFEADLHRFGVAISVPIEFSYPDNWWRKNDWL